MKTKYSIRIHEWNNKGTKGATIWFYRNGTAYSSYDVSLSKAHEFWMRASKKGIINPF